MFQAIPGRNIAHVLSVRRGYYASLKNGDKHFCSCSDIAAQKILLEQFGLCYTG